MLNRLKEIFSLANDDNEDSFETNNLDNIVPLAAATVLLEVAWADHSLESHEIALIHDSLVALYDIDEDTANKTIERAQSQRSTNTSLYPFTRQLNEQLTIEEKRKLLEHLWRLNAFDGSPFHFEEGVIRTTAELLNLRHSEFIAAKIAAKDGKVPDSEDDSL